MTEPEPVKPSSRHFFEEGEEDQEGEGDVEEGEEREAFSNSEEENDNSYADEAMCHDMEEKVDQINSTADSLKDAIHSDADDLLSNMNMPSLPLTPEDLAPLSPTVAQNGVVAASSQATAAYTLLPAKPRSYGSCSAAASLEQSPLLSSNSSLSSGKILFYQGSKGI